MPRIRTIKPDFFRHEELQDLEAANPGSYPMLVFAALWGHCDKAGRFEWKPRTLKLDILPFLNYDLAHTLSLLVEAGFVRRYECGGKVYGEVRTFAKHQRIGGKEAQEEVKHPEPAESRRGSAWEAPGKQSGSTGEAVGIAGREGKGIGKEEEGNGIQAPRKRDARPAAFPAPPDVDSQVWHDWLKIRKAKRAPPTETAVDDAREQAARAGIRLEDALRICCARGWAGFNADWDWRPKGNGKQAALEARNRAAAEEFIRQQEAADGAAAH